MAKKYVITGGPGVGKTSVIEFLAECGYNIVPECARRIIANEALKERFDPGYKGIFPWTRFLEFQKKVIKRQISKERFCCKRELNFLDRSLVDNLAYSELANTDLGEESYDQIRKAGYTKVFLLEQLPCYECDSERKENQEEAIRLHKQIEEVYKRLGYDLITVPVFECTDNNLKKEERIRKSVNARVNFILENILFS